MSEIKALIFDQDGTIIDTEKDGHRVAFNKTFKEFGFDITWDVETYHELLQIAGGKERMRHYLHTEGFGKPVDPSEEDQLIKDLHKRKTEMLIEMLENNELPLRPGVHRLMKEAQDRNLTLGICTTSNEKAAAVVANKLLKDIDFAFVLAGDVVSKKKPDPEIYELALKETGYKPEECIVLEDSRNGVLAAKAAGMPVVATTNVYTEREDLSEAEVILTSLGDPESEKGRLKKGLEGIDFNGVLTLDQLLSYFS
jgi:HAD superfamily hydrolase (TIGR01509 family)